MIKAAGLLSWRFNCVHASAQRYCVGLMKPHKPNLSQVVPNCRSSFSGCLAESWGPHVQMCKAITYVTAVSRSWDSTEKNMTLKSTQENQVVYWVSIQMHIFNFHGSQFQFTTLYAGNGTHFREGTKKCMNVALATAMLRENSNFVFEKHSGPILSDKGESKYRTGNYRH